MFWLSKLSLTTNLFIYTGIQQVLVTLLNQSMTFKNTKKKKHLKIIIFFPNSNMIFRHFQGEKHLV
jgi:hypothetical protein